MTSTSRRPQFARTRSASESTPAWLDRSACDAHGAVRPCLVQAFRQVFRSAAVGVVVQHQAAAPFVQGCRNRGANARCSAGHQRGSARGFFFATGHASFAPTHFSAMSRVILPEPPAELKQLSVALSERLRADIAAHGPLSFAVFMDRALYEPGLGYYSAGLHKLGAVRRFRHRAGTGGTVRRLSRPPGRRVGGLRCSLTTSWRSAPARASWRLICSGRCRRSARLHATSSWRPAPTCAGCNASASRHDAPGWLDRVTWLEEPPATAWRGVLIANEVIDALAAERFRISAEGVEQICVTVRGARFRLGFPASTDRTGERCEAGRIGTRPGAAHRLPF